jgi:hypothetical protein
MRAFIAILLLLCAPLAHADAIARQGNDWVRLTARPCADPKVLAHIPDPKRQLDFRAATAHFQGQTYSGCWTPIPGGAGVIYEDGDQGLIPLEDLKPAPEA